MAYGYFLLSVAAALMQIVLVAGSKDCLKAPSGVDPFTCCSVPELITDEIKENCKEFLKDSPSQTSFKPMANEKMSKSKNVNTTFEARHELLKNLCFMNCVLNNTGILENDKLNESKLSAHLRKVILEMPQMIPVLENSFKNCSAKVAKVHQNIHDKMHNRKSSNQPETTKNQCPQMAGHLMDCVFMETLIHCPATVWSTKTECNEYRGQLEGCQSKNEHSMENSSGSSSEEEKMMQ